MFFFLLMHILQAAFLKKFKDNIDLKVIKSIAKENIMHFENEILYNCL